MVKNHMEYVGREDSSPQIPLRTRTQIHQMIKTFFLGVEGGGMHCPLSRLVFEALFISN